MTVAFAVFICIVAIGVKVAESTDEEGDVQLGFEGNTSAEGPVEKLIEPSRGYERVVKEKTRDQDLAELKKFRRTKPLLSAERSARPCGQIGKSF